MDPDGPIGPADQAGLDIDRQRIRFFNMDAKHVDMNSTVTLSGAIYGEVAVDIDPWILGLGVDRRFESWRAPVSVSAAGRGENGLPLLRPRNANDSL